MVSDAGADELVTLAGRRHEALSLDERDPFSTALNQTGLLQFPRGIRDGWPLNTEHFSEYVLRDEQRVIVAAVAHHQQPTRKSLLKAMGTIAGNRHHDLLEKGLNVRGRQPLE